MLRMNGFSSPVILQLFPHRESAKFICGMFGHHLKTFCASHPHKRFVSFQTKLLDFSTTKTLRIAVLSSWIVLHEFEFEIEAIVYS